jgi:hypothetical protein
MMPRINRVKKCQKDQGECSKCHLPLPVGSPYIFWKFRYGGKVKRCTSPGCYPKPSELTQSEFLTLVYSAEETLSAFTDKYDAEAVVQALEDAYSNVEEARDLRHEAADNIEQYFEGSEKAEELREQGDEAEQWLDEIERAKDDAEEVQNGDWEPTDDESVEDRLTEIMDEALASYPF